MCGRFGLWQEDGIYHRFNIVDHVAQIPLRYNIAPGMDALVVTRNSPNKAEIMRWGLIPPWAKDMRIGMKMINARAETIQEKPSYRSCFEHTRCLVPFNAFYEWEKGSSRSTPYLFHDTQSPYLAFAGIYTTARDADDKEIRSFSIITTQANASMGGIHDRMPVILAKDEEEMWLDKNTRLPTLQALLDGYSSPTFEHYVIRPAINSAGRNSPDLISPA